MSSSDMNIIEKLRHENLEQFFTLVRMHLSFVVDINTDEWVEIEKYNKNKCINSVRKLLFF